MLRYSAHYAVPMLFISAFSLCFASGKVPVCFDTQCSTLCRYRLFLRFLCVSLLAKCLYASVLNALRCADASHCDLPL